MSLEDSLRLPMYPRSGPDARRRRGGGRNGRCSREPGDLGVAPSSATRRWSRSASRSRRRTASCRCSWRRRARSSATSPPSSGIPVVGHGAELAAGLDAAPGRRAVQHRQPACAPRRRPRAGHDGDQLPRRSAARVRRPQRHDVGHPQRRARARHHVAPHDRRRRRRRRRRDRAVPDRRRRDGVLAERPLLRGRARELPDASRPRSRPASSSRSRSPPASTASSGATTAPLGCSIRRRPRSISARDVRALDLGRRIANTVGAVRWVLGRRGVRRRRGAQRTRRPRRRRSRARWSRSTRTASASRPSTAISSCARSARPRAAPVDVAEVHAATRRSMSASVVPVADAALARLRSPSSSRDSRATRCFWLDRLAVAEPSVTRLCSAAPGDPRATRDRRAPAGVDEPRAVAGASRCGSRARPAPRPSASR